MGKDSLGDRSSPVNPPCPFCNRSPPLEVDWEDFIEENLAKIKALIAVATWEGIGNCYESTQHHYLSVLDELSSAVTNGFKQMRQVKRSDN